MRLREAHIPILLWVSAAAMIHLGGGEQADKLADLHEAKGRLRVAARGIASPDVPLEVDIDFGPTDKSPTALPPEPKPDDEKPPVPDLTEEEKKKKAEKAPKVAEKKDPPKVDPKKPEPPKPEPKPEDLKEQAKKEEEKKPEPAEPLPPPPPPDDKKIAVQQIQKEDEKPNEAAKHLAEKNHHVKPGEETHATITSLSENNPDPTPGTHNSGPADQPGNSQKTVIAQDENRKGEKVSPNVVPKGLAVKEPVVEQLDPKKVGPIDANDKPKTPAPPTPPAPTVATNPQNPSDGKGKNVPQPAAPDVIAAPNGPFTAPPSSPTPTSSVVAVAPSAAPPGAGDGKAKVLPTLPGQPAGPKWVKGLGFGQKGEGGKPSISIDEKVTKAAVGLDELDRLKKVEGETKLSEHRGAWKSSSLERWKPAIQNYVPGVKPGNQTNLGTAAAPWATYLAQIHVRLHPIFAETFVDGLGDLPASHPLNDKSLKTKMEIVMRADGTIHHLGIVVPSGVTAFDVAALDAVDRAGPFGKAPDAIVSPDGLVYLHWEFHRDEMRCSNVNAYPYVLKEGATPKPPEPKEPPKPTPAPEGQKPGGQLGWVLPRIRFWG